MIPLSFGYDITQQIPSVFINLGLVKFLTVKERIVRQSSQKGIHSKCKQIMALGFKF